MAGNASTVLILGRTGQVACELAAVDWPSDLAPVIAGRPEFDMARPETLEPLLASRARAAGAICPDTDDPEEAETLE